MLTDQPVDALLTQFLEALPDAAVYLEAIRDEQHQLTDLRLAYGNERGLDFVAQGIFPTKLSERWLGDDPARRTALYPVFRQYASPLLTGQTQAFDSFNSVLHRTVPVTCSRLGNGILVIVRDPGERPADPPAAPELADLLGGILEASLNGIITYESIRDDAGQIIDFRFVRFNNAARRMLALTDETVGKPMLNELPGVQEAGLFGRFVGVVETGEPVRFETPFPAGDERLWYEMSVVKLGDGFVITFNDITGRKQTTAEIERQAEENGRQAQFLNSILDSSSNGIVAERAVRDADGTILDFQIISANQQAATIVNSTVDELVGRGDLELHPNLRESGIFDVYVRTIETGEPQFTETHYNDGRLDHWVNIHTRKLGTDELVITFTSLSETKRLQQALERSVVQTEYQAELMQSMLDGAINGVLLLEPVRDEAAVVVDFKIRAANRAVKALTGADPVSAVGRTMQEVYPNYKEGGFFRFYCAVLTGGQPLRHEYYYEDDTLRGWFDVSGVKQEDRIVITFNNITEAKQARQLAEQATVDLQAVIDNSQTGIFVFSPIYDETGQLVDFRFKTINRMVAALVGQTPDMLTGAVASDWFISYRETGLFNHYKQTFDTGEEQRFDIHYNVDGFDVWFDVHSMRVGSDVLVTFTDYTDLKRTQLAVERQAELLNSVLDSSDNGIIAFESIRDAAGTIVDFRFNIVNQACVRLLNLTLDQMVGNMLLTLFPGNVEAGLFDLYRRTTETGEPGRTEVYYNHDGLDFWLDISTQKLGDGFVVTFTDVSTVKRTAQAIERSAAELQTVIDTSQTGIFLFSPVRNRSEGDAARPGLAGRPEAGDVVDFRFRVANRQLASYVGQEPAAVIGALGSTWFPGYKTNGLFDAYYKTYATGEPQRFDFHYDNDGINVWLDILSTKLGDEVLVTFGDYTPLKQLQQQLENSVVDLQRSNRNLEQFAYVASHDLQEPLRKIQAFGDLIQNQYAPVMGLEGVDIIRRMQSAAARMQVLIRDVLAYSRIATKREAVGPVDLNGLVNGVLGDLETAIEERQAVVTVDPLPTLTGDVPQLRQLFQNLIGNALKFAKPGELPTVHVTSRCVAGRDADMAVLPGDLSRTFHLIEVTDNGIGFEPQHAERIFQVFQRLHNRSSYEGTGIGLAIVQKVIENHQGYIRAESRLGQGATFRMLLPV